MSAPANVLKQSKNNPKLNGKVSCTLYIIKTLELCPRDFSEKKKVSVSERKSGFAVEVTAGNKPWSAAFHDFSL